MAIHLNDSYKYWKGLVRAIDWHRFIPTMYNSHKYWRIALAKICTIHFNIRIDILHLGYKYDTKGGHVRAKFEI
jgi:hypothetical protein